MLVRYLSRTGPFIEHLLPRRMLWFEASLRCILSSVFPRALAADAPKRTYFRDRKRPLERPLPISKVKQTSPRTGHRSLVNISGGIGRVCVVGVGSVLLYFLSVGKDVRGHVRRTHHLSICWIVKTTPPHPRRHERNWHHPHTGHGRLRIWHTLPEMKRRN